jgi:siroheme synthase (precorrin-2 oxidase/ferrochelatase)
MLCQFLHCCERSSSCSVTASCRHYSNWRPRQPQCSAVTSKCSRQPALNSNDWSDQSHQCDHTTPAAVEQALLKIQVKGLSRSQIWTAKTLKAIPNLLLRSACLIFILLMTHDRVTRGLVQFPTA